MPSIHLLPIFCMNGPLVLVAESLPKALTKLDELITQSPNHVAGRPIARHPIGGQRGYASFSR